MVAVPFCWLVYLMTRDISEAGTAGCPRGALDPVVGLKARSTGGVWRTGLLLWVWSSGDICRSPLSTVVLLQSHMRHCRGWGPWPWAVGQASLT